MSEWIPIEMLMKNEEYDDSHLGVSNRYGIYIEMESEDR